jgi:hypothetical protein
MGLSESLHGVEMTRTPIRTVSMVLAMPSVVFQGRYWFNQDGRSHLARFYEQVAVGTGGPQRSQQWGLGKMTTENEWTEFSV